MLEEEGVDIPGHPQNDGPAGTWPAGVVPTLLFRGNAVAESKDICLLTRWGFVKTRF